MDHIDHLMIVKSVVAKCKHGHEAHLFTTDGASCSCGKWQVWASTKKEVDAAHDAHLEFVKQQDEHKQRFRYAQEVTLHEMLWRGPQAAYCKGCNWQVLGMESSRIVEAFSNHMQTVRRNSEFNPT